MPHPGRHCQPKDPWSDGSTPPDGDVLRIGGLLPRPRALRLAGAIGIVVGGLCLVLGTLALVVELGPRLPGKPLPVAQESVKPYQGPGKGLLRRIDIPGRGLFAVAWSFSCPPGQSGAFRMADSPAAIASNPDVIKAGPHGHGKWLDDRAGRQRSLFILADCRWHAKVLEPANTATASPRPGYRTDQHNPTVNQPKPKPQPNAHSTSKPGPKHAHLPRDGRISGHR